MIRAAPCGRCTPHLLDGREHVLQLLDPAAEEIELTEDGRLVEVELRGQGQPGGAR